MSNNATHFLDPDRKMIDTTKIYGIRVLFVDDVKLNANLGKLILEKKGCDVTIALSGQEAIDSFSASPESFDIIITDLNMPNMNGFKLSKKSLAIRPGIPILLVTGDDNAIDNELVESTGITEVLGKPLDGITLTDAIIRAIQ